jgi:hypothetical protein
MSIESYEAAGGIITPAIRERVLCPRAGAFNHKACGWCHHRIPRHTCDMCTTLAGRLNSAKQHIEMGKLMSRSITSAIEHVYASHQFDCANCDAQVACGDSPVVCQYRDLLPPVSQDQLETINVNRLLDCLPMIRPREQN